MAAADPAGAQQYWFNGQPFDGLRPATSPPDTGTNSFWSEGQPADWLFPATGGGPSPPTNQNIVAFFISP